MENTIKALQRRYLHLSIIWCITFVLAMLANTYVGSLNRTIELLSKCKGTVDQLPMVIKKLDQTTSKMQKILPPNITTTTPEVVLYDKIEEIKGRFGNATVTIKELSESGDTVVLPLSLQDSIKNQKEYNDLLRNISALQGSSFPFFIIEGLNLGVSDKKDSIKVELTGRLEGFNKGKPIVTGEKGR